MQGMSGAAVAGAHLLSLVLMGASRKVFGPEVVAERLVPHRGDIGAAAFFSIGVGALVQLGLLGTKWAPGGSSHLAVALLAQLGYLASLVARGDLPPTHPHRLVLLVVVWFGLLSATQKGSAMTQVLLEVASLWIVKLRFPAAVVVADPMDEQPGVAAIYLKSGAKSKAAAKAKAKGKSPQKSPQGKSAAAAAAQKAAQKAGGGGGRKPSRLKAA